MKGNETSMTPQDLLGFAAAIADGGIAVVDLTRPRRRISRPSCCRPN
jgi:hypothetical protein